MTAPNWTHDQKQAASDALSTAARLIDTSRVYHMMPEGWDVGRWRMSVIITLHVCLHTIDLATLYEESYNAFYRRVEKTYDDLTEGWKRK